MQNSIQNSSPSSGNRDNRQSVERRLTRRLIARSVALFGFVVLVLLTIATIIISHDANRDSEERMFREAAHLRDVLVMIMLDEAEMKRERASRFISSIHDDSLITEIRVFSNDTIVEFSSEPDELGEKLDLAQTPLCKDCHMQDISRMPVSRVYTDSLGAAHRHFVLQIENRPACQKCHDDSSPNRATMVVDFSLTRLQDSAAQTRIKLFGLLVILLIAFVVLIHALLTRAVYQPLVVIAERLQGLAAGYFGDYRDHQKRGAEDIMSHIHHHIDITANQLESSYELLESEVVNRTKSLKESEDALRRERNKLRLILDAAPNCIIESTTEGRITFANSRIKEVVGVDVKDAIGRTMPEVSILAEIFTGDTVRKARQEKSLYRIVRGDQRIAVSGGSRHYNIRATRIETPEGPQALLIMLVDATLEKEVEAHLERHERLAAIGQLAAGVAHEVGNPLSAISSIAQLMRESLEREDHRTHIDLIAYHIDRINRIVRGLSRFSRTPSDRLEKTLISSIIQAALEIARFDERASGVDIVTKYPENERIQALPQDTLMQAFINLIMNSFDAVSDCDNPKLLITVRQNDKETSVSFSDNGHGISEANLKRLVEPFYTTKPEGSGTGLGLFVTHKIVEELNGRLDIESREGEGATFTITIPRDID